MTNAATSDTQSPMILSVLPLLALFAAAAALFWLTTQDGTGTYKYWETFVPVVALLSLFSGWQQCLALDHRPLWYLVRQVVHWGTIIALLYLFTLVGFRELVTDQQYTVLLLGVLAAATLLAAIHIDFKLILFALFLGYCAYVLFQPADNPALAAAGRLFRVDDPQANPAIVTAALALAGFIGSLVIMWLMPRATRRGEPETSAAAAPSGAETTAAAPAATA